MRAETHSLGRSQSGPRDGSLSHPEPDAASLAHKIVSMSSGLHPNAVESVRRKWDTRLAATADQTAYPWSLDLSSQDDGSAEGSYGGSNLGRNLWITRKGAIKAAVGDEGVIPGSMGTKSYVVKGKGVAASFNSCSHGAGRRMSRSKAKATLTVESLELAMKGKTWNADHALALLDEHPASYKDIDQVMADQSDLVEVQHTLHQIFNYKGTR